jgi:hypothetical protein
MRNLAHLLKRQALADQRDDWMMFVPGIVVDNEDPENQHRCRLLIPSIDENRIYDKWAWQTVPFVGPAGYGWFSVPEKNSEVVVCGRLGQKHNIYFMSVYNENFIIPKDFPDSATVGMRAPGNLKLISEGDMHLRMGGGSIQNDFGAFRIISPGGIFLNDRPV